MPQLAIDAAGKYEKREIKRPITAGAAPSNGILLSAGAARHEFKIASDTAGWFIEDLGTRESVLVNGIPILRKYLRDGDEISVGDDTVVFHNDEPEAVAIIIAESGPRPALIEEFRPPAPKKPENPRRAEDFIADRRARSKATSFAVYTVAAALLFYGFAFYRWLNTANAHAFEVENALGLLERNAPDAESAAGRALALPLQANDRNRIEAILERRHRERSEAEAREAASASDEAVLRRFPGSIRHLDLLYSLVTSRGSLQSLLPPSYAAWRSALDAEAELSRRARFLDAADVMLRFADDQPNSVYAARARQFAYEDIIAASDPDAVYSRLRSPSKFSLKLSNPADAAQMRVISGNWLAAGAGLTLQSDSRGVPLSAVEYSRSEYSSSQFWLKAVIWLPKGSSCAIGIRGSDKRYLRLSLDKYLDFEISTCLLNTSSCAYELGLPPNGLVEIEMGCYAGRVLVYVNGEKRFDCPLPQVEFDNDYLNNPTTANLNSCIVGTPCIWVWSSPGIEVLTLEGGR